MSVTITKLSTIKKDTQKICEFITQHAKNRDAIEKVEGKLEKITYLDLKGEMLPELPDLRQIPNLICLDIASNCLNKFPEQIYNLQKLEILILRGNKIKELPKDLATKCLSLNEIEIIENPIREVPISLRNIVQELPYMAKWV